MDPNADPGWPSAASNALRVLIPGWASRYGKQRPPGADGLIILRGLYVSFLFALAFIGVAVAVLEGTGGDLGSASESVMALVVVAVGLVSLVVAGLATGPLNCESEQALANAYRQRFFLRIALSEVAALVGFVGFIVSGAGWLYPLGAVFTVIGFVRLAPTARHLAQDQDDLRRRGCAHSLVPALRRWPERG
jgi:hypothetical protein